MKFPILHKIITVLIAIVWLINGLYCKILNQVPRHEAIVAQVLNTGHLRLIIIVIGLLEVSMAIWILSKYQQKLNAILQIVIVLIMNIIEFTKASELLLWQKYNMLFAILFIVVVYLNNFYFNKREIHVS